MAGYSLLTLMLVGVDYVSCNPAPLDELTINLNLRDTIEDEGPTDYKTSNEDLEIKAGPVTRITPVVIGGYDGETGTLIQKDECYVSRYGWSWIQYSMDQFRSGFDVATLNNDLYVAGGQDKDKNPLNVVLTRTWSGRWKRDSFLRHTRAFATLTKVEIPFHGTMKETLMVTGGRDEPNGVVYMSSEIYLPGTLIWSINEHDMIGARYGHAAVFLNARLYALGGSTLLGEILQTTEFFNTADRTWNIGPPMNQKRTFHAATVLGADIYICGGTEHVGTRTSRVILQSCEVGNGRDNYVLKGNMKVARTHFGMLTVGAEIWAIGGYNKMDSLKTVEKYDPINNMWNLETQELMAPRFLFGTTTVLVTIGGGRLESANRIRNNITG